MVACEKIVITAFQDPGHALAHVRGEELAEHFPQAAQDQDLAQDQALLLQGHDPEVVVSPGPGLDLVTLAAAQLPVWKVGEKVKRGG